MKKDSEILNEAEGLPIIFDWCEYEGEKYFAAWNYEESMKQRKQIFDLHYCATAALNNNMIEKTVEYDKNKFNILD